MQGQTIIFLLFTLLRFDHQDEIRLPIKSSFLELTGIGDFGIMRKARPKIPAHLHTGIDIKRPNDHYFNEPIFPIADGEVISKRTDGAYAQLILFHDLASGPIWTVYEHIAEIEVDLGQFVSIDQPIARFFHKEELDQHGWQFDHFHFEILKEVPIKIQPSHSHPNRHFRSYTLVCYDQVTLLEKFYDPIQFFTSIAE